MAWCWWDMKLSAYEKAAYSPKAEAGQEFSPAPQQQKARGPHCCMMIRFAICKLPLWVLYKACTSWLLGQHVFDINPIANKRRISRATRSHLIMVTSQLPKCQDFVHFGSQQESKVDPMVP